MGAIETTCPSAETYASPIAKVVEHATPLSDDAIYPFIHETFTMRISNQKKEEVPQENEAMQEERPIQKVQMASETVEQTIEKLRVISQMIAPIEGMKQLAKEMGEKFNNFNNGRLQLLYSGRLVQENLHLQTR